MKKINTVGRPKKKLSEIKPYRANVKMTTEIYFTLKAKSKESGISISEFIRLAVTNSVIKQRLSPETLDLIRKLCGMANNLNQLARSANTFGYNDDNMKFMFLADKIDNLLNMIRL